MPDLLVVLVIILVAVVLWRGPKTLPQLGESLGRAWRGVRRESSGAPGEPGGTSKGPGTGGPDDHPPS